ncbi:MAG: ATP-binding protein [Dehalococcoidia bacterium]
MDRLAQLIADHARRIVRCRYAALAVFDEKRRIRSLITSGIAKDVSDQIRALPQGKGLLGLVFDSDKPLLVEDLASHPAAIGFPQGHPPMKSFLGVPIMYRGKSLGILYVTDKTRGHRFTQTDAQLLTVFAAQAGTALENAQLFGRAEHQGLESGQDRISMETIINSMAEGIYTLDSSLRITRVNRYAAQMVDMQVDQLLGRKCCDVFHFTTPSGAPLCQTACPAHQAMASEKPGYVMEARLRVDEDREIPVAILAAAIHNEAGEVVGVVETCRDISERKEVDDLRDSIISHVSHELRTPLSHIKGFASSLLQPDVEWDDETRNDFVRTIDREADRLSRLVTDLLDMSRLESGRSVMNPEAIEPARMVQSTIDRVAAFFQQHVIETDITSDMPLVAVDAGQAERVLENLLENAAKYSAAGSRIVVSAQVESSYLRIGVHDQGVGVPDGEHERIFEKFVRLEQDRAFRSPGTGLGLSICKAIVEAHGGRIWLESNTGGGSIFYFTLPLSLGRP